LHTACKLGQRSTIKFLFADQLNTKNSEMDRALSIIRLLLERRCSANIPNMKGETAEEIPLNEDLDCLLHIACQRNYVDLVRYLIIDQACNPNVTNISKYTPLHIACKHGHLLVAKILVSRKECDLNIPDESGNTPLHTACKHDRCDIVQFLVANQRCELNTKNTEMNTPLYIACHNKSLRIIRLLLDRKCDTDIPNKSDKIEETPLNEDGDRLLHIACEWGNMDIVWYIIYDQGYNPNITNASGNTPLHTAFKHSHLDVVMLLVNIKECKLNVQDESGNTPLHLACYIKALSIVKLLLQRRCSTNIPNKKGETAQKTPLNEDGDCLLHIACQWKDVELVKYLVNDRCNLNIKNTSEYTPLHTASECGNLDIVKVLVSRKECNLNVPDKSGDTPLHTACKHGHHFIVELLVADERCQINTQNSEMNTPLHIACYTKSLKIISLLLQRRCRTNIPNKKGELAQEIPLNEDEDCLLHTVCQWGDDSITKYLITNQRNPNIRNSYMNTPLHVAVKCKQNGTIVQLLSCKECNPNVYNREGDAPLHIAVRENDTTALSHLLTHEQCNPNVQNKEGDTPLHIACHNNLSDFIRLLLERKCRTNIPNKKGEIAQEIPLNEDGDCLLHTACQWGDVGIIKYLINNQRCDPNIKNCNMNTPLYISVVSGNLQLCKLVMANAHCDVNISNKAHMTPLLAAIKHKKASVATALLQHRKCDLTLCDPDGNTALHLACISGETQADMVKIARKLLSRVDPSPVNNAGQTPIELTTNYKLIKEISHFTKCKTKHPVQTYINIFIVGNPETGKSTLVKAIRKEASTLWKILPKQLRRVKNVPLHTAGIIPTTFQSKTFGNTVLYDLADQIEYYTCHAAVIQTTVISTPPAFIVVVNMSESEEKIIETLCYWWSFINNHAARASKPPQVILVGSHADKVKAKGESVREKMFQVSAFLKRFPASFYFAGQVALDCRDPASRKLLRFCSLVNNSCCELRRTADVDLHCHVLYAFLLDKFPGKVACTVSDITTTIQKSDALLPQNPDDLIPLISTLSDKGLLLLVRDSVSSEDSWVILQKQALLGGINGVIFAPKHFSQYKKDLSSSTGVVPLLKLKSQFPDYNPIMIAKFLTHLEFCFKVDDQETLDLLKDEAYEGDQTQNLSEEYYFFPALVSIENPLQVWEQDDVKICQTAWLYRCVQHDQLLTTLFLHVLILRLAFSFALKLDPGDSQEDSLVLRRRCSVWKRGIGWLNRVPIETVVEVGLLNQSVIVMMRCPKGEEAKCAQLRSEIIQKVLEANDEHCKAVEMSESFIHPSDVKYPFFHNAEDLKSYSLTEVARATIKEADNVLDCRGRNPFPVKDLLLFDPQATTSRELLSELFSEKHSLDKQVHSQVLEKLQEGEEVP